MSSIDRALAYGSRVEASITLTALDLEGVPDAVAFALSRRLPFSLNFYRECHTGQKTARAVLSLMQPDPDRLVRAVGQALALADHFRPIPALSGILDRVRIDVPHHHPCSAGRDYLAIDPGDRVAACQMLLEEPWTDLKDADPLATLHRHGEDTSSQCWTVPIAFAASGRQPAAAAVPCCGEPPPPLLLQRLPHPLPRVGVAGGQTSDRHFRSISGWILKHHGIGPRSSPHHALPADRSAG